MAYMHSCRHDIAVWFWLLQRCVGICTESDSGQVATRDRPSILNAAGSCPCGHHPPAPCSKLDRGFVAASPLRTTV